MSGQRQAKRRVNPRLKNHAVYKKLRTRWVKRNHLNDLEMFNTQKFPASSFLKALELASVENMSITDACTYYRVLDHGCPSSELLLKRCRDEGKVNMEMHVNHALEQQFFDLSSKVRREFSKHGTVLVDFHADPYYGDLDNPDIVAIAKKKSTCYAYSYLTADLWSPRGLQTIAVLHRPPGASISDLFWDLWARIELFVKPKLVLFDGEFATVEILQGLQDKNVKFVGRKSISNRLKLLAFCYRHTTNWEKLRAFRAVTLQDKKKKLETTVHVTFQRWQKILVGLVISPGLELSPAEAEALLSKRFGIETGYRDKHVFQARTVSKNLAFRLLLFLMAIMLWNTWQAFLLLVKRTGQHALNRVTAWRRRSRTVKLFLLRDVLLPVPTDVSRR
jgi:hypothetical protein